jgi:hypothetical protein
VHQRRQTANLTFGLSLRMDIATFHLRRPACAARPLPQPARQPGYAHRRVNTGGPPALLINPLNLYTGKQRIPGSTIPGEDLLVIMLKHMYVKVRLQQRL